MRRILLLKHPLCQDQRLKYVGWVADWYDVVMNVRMHSGGQLVPKAAEGLHIGIVTGYSELRDHLIWVLLNLHVRPGFCPVRNVMECES